jgi:hypothetical protein
MGKRTERAKRTVGRMVLSRPRLASTVVVTEDLNRSKLQRRIDPRRHRTRAQLRHEREQDGEQADRVQAAGHSD